MSTLIPVQEEELNMTLQVGLVGHDGFVIASDTKAVTGGDSTAGGPSTMRRTGATRKILVSDSGNLVCAFSGNQTIPLVARQLLGLLNDHLGADVEKCLLEKTEQILDAIGAGRLGLSGVLILAVPGIPKLWEITFAYQMGQTFLNTVSNRATGGDRGNPAVFFLERYQDGTTNRSVKELTVLAAHTVLEGHVLNPTTVDGLDVLVSENGGKPRFLGEDELQSLRDRSEALHATFKTALFPMDKP